MFIAKSAFPIAFKSPIHEALFIQAANSPFTIFSCPPGYLAKDGLVDALISQARSIIWLRLGQEDRDPATLLLSLIQSARRVQPGIGGIALEKMKLNPGPLMGWPALYNLLAQELVDGLPAPSAIVLENVHHLASVRPTLELLSSHLLAKLPNSLSKILTTYQDLPSSVLSSPVNYYTLKDLRIDYQDSLALAEAFHTDLTNESLRKALQLVDGRDLTMTGLLATCQEFGLSFLQSVIRRSKSADQLLTLLVRASLAVASEAENGALMLALYLDYCHPELSRAALGSPAIPHGPCVQTLSDGWSRLLYTWRAPLQGALRAELRGMKDANLLSLAEYLAHQGAVENAVALCFAKKSHAIAARLISNAAEEMMDRGQWVTLEGWLKQLPEDVLHEWPRLVYTQGEIEVARGHLAEARRTFAISSNLFSDRDEPEGMCQSLLAESTLAAWEGDKGSARQVALRAGDLARKAGLIDRMADINWQLTNLAASMDKLEEALVYLGQASASPTDPSLQWLFQSTVKVLQRQIDLQGQRKSQYQAYLETVQAEQGNLESLKRLLNSPALNLPEVFARRGWSHTPLLLKLAAPLQYPENLEDETKPSILKRLFQRLSISQPGGLPADAGRFYSPIGEHNASAEINIHPQLESVPPPLIPQPVISEPVAISVQPARPEEPVVEMISANLLGSFHFSINETHLTKLPSSRGLAVLKYVLMHRTQLIPRDVLMDTFWPDVDPESARNSLNVAMHSLRQALRSITLLPVILFENERYHLNPDLQVWVDVEEFELNIQDARKHDSSGNQDLEIRCLEVAVSLYQGDFMEDEPYEEWVISIRERLRLDYLDALFQLCRHYLQQEQYTACQTLGHRILDIDNCREDVYCLLMRCYASQNQLHLAIRQYQACAETLFKELGIEPAASTKTLYLEIISRQPN